jgi:cytoskeletal protein RodZ
MTMFCSKNLKKIPNLSELFRENREKQGWNIQNIYSRTHIPSKYVSALEAGEFQTLPKAKAHRIAYVKEYAATLGLDPEKCVEQFSKEEGLKDVASTTATPLKRLPFGSLSILIRNLVLGMVVAGFAAFLVIQIKNILQPPTLTIINPTDGYITSDRSLAIEGFSEHDTKVTLNGQEVALDNQNHFNIKLDLANGLNTLEITAIKKHGKTTKKIVNVIVKSAIGMR